MPQEMEQALKQWEYNEKLSFYMFQVILDEWIFFYVTIFRKLCFR